MFGRRLQEIVKHFAVSAISLSLVLALVGCSQAPKAEQPKDNQSVAFDRGVLIEEVSPPVAIQKLRPLMDRYHPQVKIVGPKPNSTLTESSVTIRFQVEDFPLFKDEALGLGPHLHVFLDDRPYQAVYDAQQSLTFKDLTPGTHTIRAFASRPWHESFKTEGAFDQLTFNIFAPTQSQLPDPSQPLLTYSRPQGEYGAEPIMLDYYLTPPTSAKATLPQSGAAPWKVRVSVNGDSFTTDQTPPLYLSGFKAGSNWVKLELLDAKGKLVPNAFNESLRLVSLQKNGKDTLSRLVRGDISAQDAEQIVDLEVSKKRAAQRQEAAAKAAEPPAVQKPAAPKVLDKAPAESIPVLPAPVQMPVASPAVKPVPDKMFSSDKAGKDIKRMPEVVPTSEPAKTIVKPDVLTSELKPSASKPSALKPSVPLPPAPSPSASLLTTPEVKSVPSTEPKLPIDKDSALKSSPSSPSQSAFWSQLNPSRLLEKNAASTKSDKSEVRQSEVGDRPIPTATPAIPVSAQPAATPSASPSAVPASESSPSPVPVASPTLVPSGSVTASVKSVKRSQPDWRKFLNLQQNTIDRGQVTQSNEKSADADESLNPSSSTNQAKLDTKTQSLPLR
ncbi:MAG TPA: hypothetical protein V6D19_09370 [Stenomitos sp.]